MSEQSVDAAALDELRSIMGNEFGLLLDVFIKDSNERLTIIQRAISANDPESLRKSAHGFKGSALNLSAGKLTELCRQLEFMGRDGQLEGAQPVFEEVKNEYAAVKSYLESLKGV